MSMWGNGRVDARAARRSPKEVGIMLRETAGAVLRGVGTGTPPRVSWWRRAGRRVLNFLFGAALGCVGGAVILAGVGQFVRGVQAREVAEMEYRPSRALMEDLGRRFTHHRPVRKQPERYQKIRDKVFELSVLIAEMTPVSREQSLAFTHLEEAVFWANAAIARNEFMGPSEPIHRDVLALPPPNESVAGTVLVSSDGTEVKSEKIED
jgi:hypothetical protein